MLPFSVTWNPSPVLFDLGPVSIRYYSLMFVIAFLLGIYLEKKIYKKDGLKEEYVDSLFVYVALATLLGARLGEVFFYSWDYYKDHLLEILFPIQLKPFKILGFSGLASHGAAIGVLISIYLFRKYKLPQKSFLWIVDRVVVAVPIGGAFVRLGNLMNSEIVGKATGTDSGFKFVRNDIGPREAMQLTETTNVESAYHKIVHNSQFSDVLMNVSSRYPTQIYEAIGYVLVFIVLWWLYWKTDKKQKEGYIFGVFMILLWSVRFIVEFWKEKQDGENIANYFNMGQILSIPLILIGFYFVVRTYFKKSS